MCSTCSNNFNHMFRLLMHPWAPINHQSVLLSVLYWSHLAFLVVSGCHPKWSVNVLLVWQKWQKCGISGMLFLSEHWKQFVSKQLRGSAVHGLFLLPVGLIFATSLYLISLVQNTFGATLQREGGFVFWDIRYRRLFYFFLASHWFYETQLLISLKTIVSPS